MEASDVLLRGPLEEDDDENDAIITTPIVDVNEGIFFNGVADDSHEAFVLSERERRGLVKTLRKPYDFAVACVLLRAFMLAPGCVEVR